MKKLLLILGVLILLPFVYSVPTVTFIPLTPLNNTATTNTSIIVNTSISEVNLTEIKYNWNGTNFSLYDSSLLFMMNFENFSSLGENNTVCADLSMYKNNGVVNGAAVWNTSGRYGGAYQLDGTAKYISAPGFNFNLTGNYSISAWVIRRANVGVSIRFITLSDTGDGIYSLLGIPTGDPTTLQASGGEVDWDIVSPTGVCQLNTWCHVVGQFTGKHANSISVNGITYTSSTTNEFVQDAHAGIYIGARGNLGSFLTGSVDEVYVYNRSLSTVEVYQLYARGLQKYNSTQWYLTVNQSKNATTALDNGTYTYFVSAKDNNSVENTSETRTIIIGAGSSSNTTTTTPFSAIWDTTKISGGSSNASQITLPLVNGGTYNFTVNWGDGNISPVYAWNSVNKTHDYASQGVYTINLTGTIIGWMFAGTGDALKIYNVSKWGDLHPTSSQTFSGCSNLNFIGNDNLNLSSTTTTSWMFYQASNFNGNISGWNTSMITDMSNMFNSASSFNQPLNNWDVSNVTNVYGMFSSATAFNGNISTWNTGKVTTMEEMFRGATNFNSDISSWNTSKVTLMDGMFYGANYFNQSIGSWDTRNVTNMYQMFFNAVRFNQPLNNWNVSKVINMGNMFRAATVFNQPLNSWDTHSVTDMSYMFTSASSFNSNISTWNVSNVQDMSYMFYQATNFNQDLSAWNPQHVLYMTAMFYIATSFNQSLNSWNVNSVTNMNSMFRTASSFNQPLNNWNISNVTSTSAMFYGASVFNQNISSWDMSHVANIDHMFRATSFNQPLNNWNVSSVTTMDSAFLGATSFNQPLNNWNTGKVISMSSMFQQATSFNQNLSNWNVSAVTLMNNMFYGDTLNIANYNALLNGWSSRSVQSSVNLHGGNSMYSSIGLTGRNILTNATNNWTITDGGIYAITFTQSNFIYSISHSNNIALQLNTSAMQGTPVFTINNTMFTINNTGYINRSASNISFIGIYNVSVNINDSLASTTMWILFNLTNTAPSFTQSNFVYSLDYNTTLSLQINATDVDGDTKLWWVNNTYFTINSTGNINRTAPHIVNAYNVSVIVGDGAINTTMWVLFNFTNTTGGNVTPFFAYLTFIPLTPLNNTNTTNTSIIVNVSIAEQTLGEIKYNWNGTNFSLYDSSLLFMMNFNNVSALGENDLVVKDLSIYGNNAQVNGAAVWNTSGMYGGAYQFDGSNDYINASGFNMNLAGSYSISFWFLRKSNPGFSARMVTLGDTTNGLYPIIGVNTGDPSRVELAGHSDATSDIYSPAGSVVLNTWYHVVGEFTGNVPTVLYLNGVPYTDIDATYYSVDAHPGVYIGTRGSLTSFFNGAIDELYIYNRSLSASEVQILYMRSLQKFNTTQWYLTVNQSKNATVGLDNGTYTYFVSAKDTSGNENVTDLRYINIGTTSGGSNTSNTTSTCLVSASLNRYTESWFGDVNITAILTNCTGNWNATANIRSTAGTVYTVALTNISNVYTGMFNIDVNGSARNDIGTWTVNVTATNGTASNTSANMNLNIVQLYRSPLSSINVTQNGVNSWTHYLHNVEVYSASAYTNVTVKYPIINQPSITGLSVTSSALNWYRLDNNNTIVVNINVSGSIYLDIIFNASSDLAVTYLDRYYTGHIGTRIGDNGYMIYNNKQASFIMPHDGNDAGKIFDFHYTYNGIYWSTYCAERGAVFTDDTTWTSGAKNNYLGALGWNNSETWLTNYNTTMIRFTSSNGDGTYWGNTPYTKVVRNATYSANLSYTKLEYFITNTGVSSHTYPFVFGVEQWLEPGGGSEAGDRGMINGNNTALGTGIVLNGSSLTMPWIAAFDSTSFYSVAYLFLNASSQVKPDKVYFLDYNPLTNSGPPTYPVTTGGVQVDMRSMWFEKDSGNISAGTTVNFTYYIWSGHGVSQDDLTNQINNSYATLDGNSPNNSTTNVSNSTTPVFTQSNFTYIFSHGLNLSLQINASEVNSTLTYWINDTHFNIGSSTGIINRTGQSNTTVVYNVSVTAGDGITNTTMWVLFNLTNTASIFTQSNFIYNINHNTNLVLQINASDLDNDVKIYGINNTGFTINSAGLINKTNNINTTGLYNVTIWSYDGNLNISMWILFNLTNTASTFTQSNFVYSISHTQNINLQINATDSDADSLYYWTNNTGFTINSAGVINRSAQLISNVYNVSVITGDGLLNTTMWILFNITNNAPTFSQSNFVYNISHNQNISLQINVTDADSDTLNYWINNTGFTINSVGVINRTSQYITGTYNVSVTAGDNMSNTSMWVLFNIINSAPTFTQSNFIYQISHGQNISLQINSTDLDNDIKTFAINDTRFTINSVTGLINKTNSISNVGLYNVSINVTDNLSTTTMWVLFNITNTVPSFTQQNFIYTTSYLSNILVQVNSTDADSDILTYASNDTRFTMNANTGILNRSASDVSFSGLYNVSINVTDNLSASTMWILFNLTNTAPTFNQSNFIYNTNWNTSFTLQINASDIENGTLAFASNDSRFTINSTNGLINRSASNSSFIGLYNVSINLSDGVSTAIMWVLFNIQDIPSIVIINTGGGSSGSNTIINSGTSCPVGYHINSYSQCVSGQKLTYMTINNLNSVCNESKLALIVNLYDENNNTMITNTAVKLYLNGQEFQMSRFGNGYMYNNNVIFSQADNHIKIIGIQNLTSDYTEVIYDNSITVKNCQSLFDYFLTTDNTETLGDKLNNSFTGFKAQISTIQQMSSNYYLFWIVIVVLLILSTIYLVFFKQTKVRR